MINNDVGLRALSAALLTFLDTTPPPCDDRWISDDRTTREAVAPLCAPCPIKAACADVAQAINPTHGVWAGHDWSQDLRKDAHT
jgi:hypothetical protein